MKLSKIKSKAQMQSQVFIYIMVAIVGGGILLFGYKAVSSFKAQADTTLFVKFETDLKNDLRKTSYGSERPYTYYLPSSVEQVCFKSAGNPDEFSFYAIAEKDYQENQGNDVNYGVITREVTVAKTENNVFLYPVAGRSFYSGVRMDLDEAARPIGEKKPPLDFQCFEVIGGSLKVSLKGQGNSVLIKEPKGN